MPSDDETRAGLRIVRFYKTAQGNQLVKAELDALNAEARGTLVSALRRRSRDENLDREDEHVKGRIWAIRATVAGAEYRLLYARVGAHKHVFLGLHCFNKKSRKLPKRVLKLAEDRLRDWERRGG